MLSLCYVSASTQRMTDSQLLTLLKECRKNNERIGITGLLLYNGKGTFMQVLQGEDQSVCELFDHITKDTRHQRVHCIGKKPIDKRDFPSWRMGFRSLNDASLQSLDSFSQFLNTDDDLTFLTDHSSFTYSILEHFKSSAGLEHSTNSEF